MQRAGKRPLSGHDFNGLTQCSPPGRVAGSMKSLARSAPIALVDRECAKNGKREQHTTQDQAF